MPDLAELEARLIAPGSFFTLSETSRNGYRELFFTNAPRTLLELFAKFASRGSQPYAITKHRVLSYGEASRRSTALAAVITKSSGFLPRNYVGVSITDMTLWTISVFGILLAGGVPVLIPSDSDVEASAAIQSCVLVLVDQQESQRASSVLGTILRVDSIENDFPQSPASTEVTCAPLGKSVGTDDLAFIVHTSGSTGAAKPVAISHRGLMTGLYNMLLAGSLSSAATGGGKRTGSVRTLPLPLAVAPLSHVSGYSSIFLAALLGGQVAQASNNTNAVIEMCNNYPITSIIGARASVLHGLLGSGSFEGISRLRSIGVAGGRPSNRLVSAYRSMKPDLTFNSGYGLSETNGGICSVSSSEIMGNSALVGRLLPTAEAAVRDKSGRPVSPGASGSLFIRGAMAMMGYVTSAGIAENQDGWIRTGDVAHLDSTRNLYISGREANLFSRNDTYFFLEDLECQMSELSGISGACVCPRDDYLDIALEFTEERSEIDRSTIAALVRAQAGNVRWNVRQVQALPYLHSGKLNRKEVAKLLDAQFTAACLAP